MPSFILNDHTYTDVQNIADPIIDKVFGLSPVLFDVLQQFREAKHQDVGAVFAIVCELQCLSHESIEVLYFPIAGQPHAFPFHALLHLEMHFFDRP